MLVYTIATSSAVSSEALSRWYGLLPSSLQRSTAHTAHGVERAHATQVQMRVECKIVKCVLKGDEFTELRVSFKEYLGVRSPCFPGECLRMSMFSWTLSLSFHRASP